MANDSGVMDRPPIVTGGGGGRATRGGGTRGTRGGQGGEGGGGAGSPTREDVVRILHMLRRIRETLDLVVHIEPPVVPEPLNAGFLRTWPEVDLGLIRAIAYVRKPLSPAIRRQLVLAGLTGDMLHMKQNSLDYHLDELSRAIAERPILTAPLSERVSGLERIVKWFKPSAATINSVLGSMPKAIPGVEIAKEFKEHLEAGWEIVETAQEEREL